jgi:hypothetical protein
MSGFYVMANNGETACRAADTDVARWTAIKYRSTSDRLAANSASVAVIGTSKLPDTHIARTPDGDWLCYAGAWVNHAGIRFPDTQALLARYLDIGAHALAKEMDGTFALAIGDSRSGHIYVITDPRGSMHVYAREDATGTAICTSSQALSTDGRLDPIGAYEFITTGIIYEDRSLWAGIRKLPPAAIVDIAQGSSTVTHYWTFRDALTTPLSLDDAADSLTTAMSLTLKQIGVSHQPVLADLTGGYDSRLLLLGLLDSGIRFANTVVGRENLPDVVTARQIADRLNLSLTVQQEPDRVDAASFDSALRLCDGEFNVFEYANIQRNQAPFVANHGASLNGSFGEVARGYWWELLWPKLNTRTPLDANMLARKRFAAIPFIEVFNKPPVDSLAMHLAGVVRRTIEPVQDLTLASQMDCVYLGMRMQRWQGRIASNTNQIWPALAPLGFTTTLTPMLAARPAGRFRSLMPRYIFHKRHPILANIPLEHGYPPTLASLANLHQFIPLLDHYGQKIQDKLASKLGGSHQSATTSPTTLPSAAQRYPDLMAHNLAESTAAPHLMGSGLFNEAALRALLDPNQPIGGNKLVQWQRLITLETSLQAHAIALSKATNGIGIIQTH